MFGHNGNSVVSSIDGGVEQVGTVVVGLGATKDAQFLGLGLSKLTRKQRDDLDRAKRYALDQSVKFVLNKQQVTHQQNQQRASQLTQALLLMARLYIGSVSFEIREENIRQMFSIFGPIKSLNMSYDSATGNHKGFAFLEYEVPEAAILAIEAMNGKLIGGRNLKVGRTSNMPAAQPIIEMVTQEAKQYHRIYVAAVHPDLSENDLTNVFGAFGEIKKVQLARQPQGRGGHRGFGYIEFGSKQAVKEAIEGMNNFDLGGQYLQVGRCVTPPEALMYIVPSTQSVLPSASATAAAKITAAIQAKEMLKKNEAKEPPKPKALPAPPPKLLEPVAPKSLPTIKKEPNIDAPVALPPPPPPKLVEPIAPKSLPSVKRGSFVPISSTTELTDPVPPPPATSDTPHNSILMKINTERKIGKKKMRAMAKEKIVAQMEEAEENDRRAAVDAQLMLEGPAGNMASTALAVRNDAQLATINKEKKKDPKAKSKSLSLAAVGLKRKRKTRIPRERKPKLNSAGAMAAVFKAGAINDQMQAVHQKNEEATLASQEHVEIRGNDARHMLMHKLMRTNRSAVMVLKNMVDINGVDDELEDEIRDECSKHGTVTDVVIAKVKSLEEVRIFVQFADPTQAEKAVEIFDGRFFDGKTIKAQVYDSVLFDHDDFTG